MGKGVGGMRFRATKAKVTYSERKVSIHKLHLDVPKQVFGESRQHKLELLSSELSAGFARSFYLLVGQHIEPLHLVEDWVM